MGVGVAVTLRTADWGRVRVRDSSREDEVRRVRARKTVLDTRVSLRGPSVVLYPIPSWVLFLASEVCGSFPRTSLRPVTSVPGGPTPKSLPRSHCRYPCPPLTKGPETQSPGRDSGGLFVDCRSLTDPHDRYRLRYVTSLEMVYRFRKRDV